MTRVRFIILIAILSVTGLYFSQVQISIKTNGYSSSELLSLKISSDLLEKKSLKPSFIYPSVSGLKWFYHLPWFSETHSVEFFQKTYASPLLLKNICISQFFDERCWQGSELADLLTVYRGSLKQTGSGDIEIIPDIAYLNVQFKPEFHQKLSYFKKIQQWFLCIFGLLFLLVVFPFISRKGKIGVLTITTATILILCWLGVYYINYITFWHASVDIDIQKQKDPIILFYNSGQGFSEGNTSPSHRHHFSSTELYFSLPHKSLQQIRIDLGSQEQHLSISSFCLHSSLKDSCWEGQSLLDVIQHTNDLKFLNVEEKRIFYEATGSDPYFLLNPSILDTVSFTNKIQEKYSSYNSLLGAIIPLLIIILLLLFGKHKITSYLIPTTSRLVTVPIFNGVFLLLCFILLFIQGALDQIFSGTPFNTSIEFLLLLFFVFLGAHALLVGKLSFDFDVSKSGKILMMIVVGAIIFKSTASDNKSPTGFTACFHSLVDPLPEGECEQFLENPRYDETIDFEGHWDLWFWNNRRFNNYQWVPKKPVRERNSFEVEWQGQALIPNDLTKLSIVYIGEGFVTINEHSIKLPPSYKNINEIKIPLYHYIESDQKYFDFKLNYRYLSTALIGEDPKRWETLPQIEIENLKFYQPNKNLLSWAIDIVMLMIIISILTETVLYFWKQKKEIFHSFNPVLLLLLLFVLQLVMLYFIDFSGVTYQSPGGDHLGYEGFAREILSESSAYEALRGVKSVFYYQPFFRYYLAWQYYLFGDSNQIIFVFNQFIFSLFIPFIWMLLSKVWSSFVAFIGAIFFLILLKELVWPFLFVGLSEYVAWFCVLVAFLCVLWPQSRRDVQMVAMILCGVALITRINFAPGIFYLIALMCIKDWLYGKETFLQAVKKCIPSLLIFFAIAALVPLHNYLYGGEWVLTTKSADIPENLLISPNELWNIPLNEKINYLKGRSSELFFMENKLTLWGLYLWCFAWLVHFFKGQRILFQHSSIESAKQWFWNAGLLFTPITFLVVHIFYQVSTYYPRHIVMGSLLIFLTAAFYLGLNLNTTNKAYIKNG